MSNRKIVSHSVKPFTRYGIKINEALWLEGVPYFTSKAIAEWLEIKEGFRGILKIVRRNPYILEHTKEIDVILQGDYDEIDENDQEDVVANLATACTENSRTRVTKIRVYSPIGLQLITLESKT